MRRVGVLSKKGAPVTLVALVALTACGRLSGFEDFTAATPEGAGGESSGAGGTEAGAAGGPGGVSGGGGQAGWSPDCFDNERDGDETDVDCGGSCPRCARDRTCQTDADCWNNHCQSPGLCSGGCPPDMRTFETTDVPSREFCVDPYEVTQLQYAVWLASQPSLGRQTPACAAANASFSPRTTPASTTVDDTHADCTANSFRPTDEAYQQHPVTCVDWCDAAAYCLAHGRFLCGSAARPDQPFDGLSSPDDAFYEACNGADEDNVYPYGSTYSGKACNGLDHNDHTPALIDTGAAPGCLSQNGSGTAYDLVGNAAEWSNTCLTGKNRCAVRGGSYRDGDSATCLYRVFVERTDAFAEIGFRCCG